MTRAIDIEPRAVRWLWAERVPAGTLTLVAGRPGGGKSAFLTYLAATVSHRGDVIVGFLEDLKHEMVRPRLEAADANLARVHIRAPHLPDDLDSLERDIERLGVRLVVLDPIAAHLHRGISRANDSIRVVTNRLELIGERTGCAFVVADHVVKRLAARAHPLQAIGGSGSGLAAAARMVFLVGKDPDDDERVLLCCVKSNLREDPLARAFLLDSKTFAGGDGREATVPLLLPDEECEFDARRLLVEDRDQGVLGRPPEKRAAAVQWLTRYLLVAPDQQARASEIEEDAKQRNITPKTLKRAATDMGVIKTQRDRAWWWRLPQEIIDGAAANEGDDG